MFTHKTRKKMSCENEGILFVQYFKHLFSVETKDSKTNNIYLEKEREIRLQGLFVPAVMPYPMCPFINMS